MKRPCPATKTAGTHHRPCDAWDVYRAAARAHWIGRVIAHAADAAIKVAAIQFKTEAWKLTAVRRFEIA